MNQVKIANFPFSIDIIDHGQEVGVHTHDCTELVIVLSGTAIHEVDCQEYALKVGDTFVVNTHSAHGYKVAQNLKLCNIMFELDKLLDSQKELQLIPGFQSLFILEPFFRKEHKFASKLELNLEGLNFVKELVELMLREYEDRGNGFMSAMRTYFSTLITYLSRHMSSDKNKAAGKLLHLAEAITYMQSNFLNSLSIKNIAAIAFFSTRQFDRIFKSNYNMSPKEYIIKLRLEYAVKLMDTTNFNLSTISLESGFSDISFFPRQFKVKFGIAPKAYRKAQYSALNLGI